jgi:hypothetical protein
VKPESLDREGCTLGGRRVTYAALARYYVCNECGGKPVHSFVPEDRVFCGECGGDDFISETRYRQQIADAYEVLHSLPPEFRALYVDDSKPKMDGKQAISDLFE